MINLILKEMPFYSIVAPKGKSLYEGAADFLGEAHKLKRR